MAGRKVRWGIISTANIGMQKVTPAIMAAPSCEVVAISSRNEASARAAAEKLGIPRAYGSYEAMLADPEIDAVYNPLPNHLHVDLTLAAARAGKHVLCEKPIGMSAADAARLREIRDVMVMEAFMVRFHPQWERARQIVRSGELGEVRAVRAAFCYYNDDPANVRNMAEIGGGGLMDIGCYCITGGRWFFEGEPKRVVSLVERDPAFGTDRLASVLADFGGGRQLSFTVSTQAVPHQTIEVLGTKGRLELVIPFNAPKDQATALCVDAGHSLDGALARREIFPPCDQYALEAEAFAQAILTGTPLPYGIEDGIGTMRALDAIFASEKNGGWAEV